MNFELGKEYIVKVSKEGIIPIEEFDSDRFYDKDHDDLDFLTDEEKIVVINDVLDKIFPDNATNGDMIKTIFPNLEWRDERGDTKSYILEPEHILSPKLIAFNRWWDAPYKALEQESVLDKIRTEIEQVVNQEKLHDEKWALGLNYALHIIDKYKAESGGEE